MLEHTCGKYWNSPSGEKTTHPLKNAGTHLLGILGYTWGYMKTPAEDAAFDAETHLVQYWNTPAVVAGTNLLKLLV